MKYATVTASSGGKKRLAIATPPKSITATLPPTVAKRTNRKTRSRFNKSVMFTRVDLAENRRCANSLPSTGKKRGISGRILSAVRRISTQLKVFRKKRADRDKVRAGSIDNVSHITDPSGTAF